MDRSVKDALGAIELFSCMTEDQLELMARGSRRTSFGAGKPIITHGEAEADVFVITAGEAEVLKPSDGGESRQLAVVGEGAVLGEMSALTSKSAAADVMAVTDCSCIRIPRAVFIDAVKKNLSSMSRFTSTVVKRYREMMGD